MALIERAPAEAHAASVEEVAVRLGADLRRGLSAREAAVRLAAVGPNALARPQGPAYAGIAARQLADPLVALLVVAAGVSAAIGETLEAGVIAAIVVLNALVGFLQEVSAERAVLALRASLAPSATAIRAGAEVELPAEELVPGDLVRLREGDRVPADARVLATLGLEADESLLTGESVPVAKAAAAVPAETPLAERSSMLYAGTGVTRGGATALVVATGRATEQGTIAALAEEAQAPPTPLQRRLARLALWMVALGVAVTLALAAAMLLRGEPLHDAFLVGVSVAVAAVPEGLAATLTIALALGAREMARRGAVVRTLSAIETIGEATVVCTDKTGTLTENRLRLERLAPAAGAGERRLLAAALEASAGELDPVDRALADAARAAGLDGEESTVVRTLPFEAARKRATVVVLDGDGLRSVVKGAPEVVLARCGADPAEAARLAALAETWAAAGLRVLAVAERPLLAADGAEEELERGLEPLGLVALADPLRADAAASIAEARALGLRVQMLTGDHPLTAASVARALGLAGDDVHARVTPTDKLALVAALQRAGETVAVTGDGVNDAPALRQADVGVAMGRSGTEAAREASSLVLTDDAFATIVAAVREGRRIAANVRSFLAFLLSANLGEVVLFGVAVAAGLGVPMTVVQVLVVNLLTDGPPAIALAVDPAGAGREAPRRGSALLGGRVVAWLLAVGVAIGGVALAAYLVVRERRPEAAQTAAFAAVALAELAFVYACRSERAAAWRLPPNRALHAAVAASLALVAAALYLPVLHDALGTVALTASELGLVAGLALVPALLAEGAKALARSGVGGGG